MVTTLTAEHINEMITWYDELSTKTLDALSSRYQRQLEREDLPRNTKEAYRQAHSVIAAVRLMREHPGLVYDTHGEFFECTTCASWTYNPDYLVGLRCET